MLDWQLEAGVDECIQDAPVDRFAMTQAAPRTGKVPPDAPAASAPPAREDPVDVARRAAEAAQDRDALRAALAAYPHCQLKRGARNLVFADGVPGAPVMIVGEAPGRDEDRTGQPFVGRAGQLLDRMLEAIELTRTRDVYITNVLPWRPPQNRDPNADEIAMMKPFVLRHIALAAPKVLVVMGNISCQALLGRKGITRLRGSWDRVCDLPALAMFHPAYLLRNPAAKRAAWADLLALQEHLDD